MLLHGTGKPDAILRAERLKTAITVHEGEAAMQASRRRCVSCTCCNQRLVRRLLPRVVTSRCMGQRPRAPSRHVVTSCIAQVGANYPSAVNPALKPSALLRRRCNGEAGQDRGSEVYRVEKALKVDTPMSFVLHALALWRRSFTVDWKRSFESLFAFEAMVPVTSLVKFAAQ